MFLPAGRRLPATPRGFTLLEVAICVLVVGILATMLFPVLNSVQARAERSKCTANLHSLHVAASLYVQEHRMWPQIAVTESMPPKDIADAWITTFQPYGLSQINWICPTIQHLLQSPDIGDPENKRVDYAATAFDSNPQSPFQWAKQPWFIESGNVHGNGNLIIFPDGHVESLNELVGVLQPRSGGPGR